MSSDAPAQLLSREEYIEQAYFFRCFRERMQDNIPAQVFLTAVNEEILSTTKLPFAIQFMAAEIVQTGRISSAMNKLSHYFAPFQSFVMDMAEADQNRFDHATALQILQLEAEYRASEPTPAGMFIFQFECIARNRLGYEHGMQAMAGDPLYPPDWRDWILNVRMQLGAVDFSDLIYYWSEHFIVERRRQLGDPEFHPNHPVLFGIREGRIAKANRGRDPLYMFAALQRQLGYPSVPRPKPPKSGPLFEPHVDQRFLKLETRLSFIESESRGGIDLSKFYAKGQPDFRNTNPDDSIPR